MYDIFSVQMLKLFVQILALSHFKFDDDDLIAMISIWCLFISKI